MQTTVGVRCHLRCIVSLFKRCVGHAITKMDHAVSRKAEWYVTNATLSGGRMRNRHRPSVLAGLLVHHEPQSAILEVGQLCGMDVLRWLVPCSTAAAKPCCSQDSDEEDAAMVAATRPRFDSTPGAVGVVHGASSRLSNLYGLYTDTDYTADGIQRLGAADITRLKKLPLVAKEVWQLVVKPLRVWAAAPEGPPQGPDAIPWRPPCAFLVNIFPAGTPLREQVRVHRCVRQGIPPTRTGGFGCTGAGDG